MILLNWNHIERIVTDPTKNGAGKVFVTSRRGGDPGSLIASSIEVVGEGSMRVNQWLNEIANKEKRND